jgi:hypothetical protein
MSRLDRVRKLLRTKIVVWGPEGAGKTLFVLSLRRRIDPDERLRVYSVNSSGERTLFFDLLALEEFSLGPVRVRTRIVAMPGASEGAAARARLLDDADAVVFVAESQRSDMESNRASLAELEAALWAKRIDPRKVPMVWAFNKQDLPDVAPSAEAKWVLSARDAPAFETVAATGEGIVEVFREALRRVIEAAVDQHALPAGDPDEATIAKVLPERAPSRAASRQGEERRAVIHIGAEEEEEAGHEADPLANSLQAQLALAEICSESDVQLRLLQERNRELMAINRVVRSIVGSTDVENLLVVILDAAADHLRVSHASCVVYDATDRSSLQTHVLGFGRDPVLDLPEGPAAEFFGLLQKSDGPIPLDRGRNEELLQALRGADGRIVRAVFAPVKNGDHAVGWIGAYRLEDEPLPGAQALIFLSSIARFAALGTERIALLEQARRFSARLEEEVRERTNLLEMANAKIRALNRGLEARVAERTKALEEANHALRVARAEAVRADRVKGMGHFAASLAAEIDAPAKAVGETIARIRASLEDLRGRVASGRAPEALESLDALETALARGEEESRRIQGVVGGLRRLGTPARASGAFSVNGAVADALTLMEERVKRCAEVDLRLGTVPEIPGDAHELGHLVHSLVTAAVEAIEAKGGRGRVEITTYASGGRASLAIRDTGAGIPEAMLPRIFEPFFAGRGGESLPSAAALQAAYQTVTRHEGTIKVRSKVGEGTSVTVLLPLARAEAKDARPSGV